MGKDLQGIVSLSLTENGYCSLSFLIGTGLRLGGKVIVKIYSYFLMVNRSASYQVISSLIQQVLSTTTGLWWSLYVQCVRRSSEQHG